MSSVRMLPTRYLGTRPQTMAWALNDIIDMRVAFLIAALIGAGSCAQNQAQRQTTPSRAAAVADEQNAATNPAKPPATQPGVPPAPQVPPPVPTTPTGPPPPSPTPR